MKKGQRYRVEAALVGLMTEEVRSVLADRGGQRHEPPWTPKQEVQVGVLRPRWLIPSSRQQNDGVGEDADDDRREEEPTLSDPDVIGVDFVVEPLGDELRLSIDADFALYLPEYPTFNEALAIYRGAAYEDSGSQEDLPTGDALGGPNPQGPRKTKKNTIPLQYAWRRREVSLAGIELAVQADGQLVESTESFTQALTEVVKSHFAEPTSARPFVSRFALPVSALNSKSKYLETLSRAADPQWRPTWPIVSLGVFAELLPDGNWLVSVSLTNITYVEEKTNLDFSVYDTELRARITKGGRLVSQRFDLAPEDYRFDSDADVPGHGRGCVAVEIDNGVRTETLPVLTQRRMVPRKDHIPELSWSSLAADPVPVLGEVARAMCDFAAEWDMWLQNQSDQRVRKTAESDLVRYRGEIGRFEDGIAAMAGDPKLAKALQLANVSFARANQAKPYSSWHLFQLVYIVTHLPALAGRSSRDRDQLEDLDTVDVLWFPTGGGKTEAYLGLTLVAAFYDRLRGKRAGLTAWLKFPLRMLSVQQLIRVLRILAVADDVRNEYLEDAGAPFELGYLVGSSNTPNSLRWKQRWWPGFAAAADAVKVEPARFDRHRLVGQCPFCLAKGNQIGLTPDESTYRLIHFCRSCRRQLPIHITDDEVYRYQPTVVVSTIDKVTGFSRYGEFTSFNRGPRWKCPQHGYFAFGICPVATEQKEPLRCRTPESAYEEIAWEDPVPALTIQDEMHLVREDLGVFASHYEGLIAELQKGGPSGLTTKVLSATATIEQFQNQLRQVYGRYPRRFPSSGYEKNRSFYTDTLAETRRVFLGVMPTGSGVSKVETAARVQQTMIELIHRFQDDPAEASFLIAEFAGIQVSPIDILDVLFNYEVSLGFVNSKNAGAQISDAIAQLSAELEARGQDRVLRRVLSGEVDVPELAEVIELIEDAQQATPRSDRLRALVGTSVVSHGVDLERLNLMVMAGLPPTTADYIQATSRSGRTYVGLVATVYDRFSRREASSFSNFLSTHRLLDTQVEPVPVNRFASRAIERTLPGVVTALLWDLARDSRFPGADRGLRRTQDMRAWWNRHAGQLERELEDRIDRTYRSIAQDVNPASLESGASKAASQRWRTREKLSMISWNGDRLTDLFTGPVMTSLRDVDVSIGFSGSPSGRKSYGALFRDGGQ